MTFTMKWTGGGIEKFEKAVKVLGSKRTKELYRSVINANGAALRRDAVKTLPEQSGLAKKTIQKALGKPIKASQNRLSYKLSTKGGFIAMKFFNPVERGSGVFAYPRSQAFFKHRGFMLSGPPGGRRDALGGHVYAPVGGSKLSGKRSAFPGSGGRSWYRPITKLISDVRIPDELTSAPMERAADKHRAQMDRDVLAGIKRLSGGIID